MSATSVTEQVKKENIVDDISESSVDQDKLAALKAKSQVKQQENKMASKIVAKKEKSLVLGVIGSGQAGSRIAEAFHKL